MFAKLAKGIERILDQLLATGTLCLGHRGERLHENPGSCRDFRQGVGRHIKEKALKFGLPVAYGIFIGFDRDQPAPDLG